MYYIDDYKKRAINKVIPYLLEFPQIVKILELNAGRYQSIEDFIWNLAENLRTDNARGVFLNALANNEVVDIIYTDKADDAFTYGSQWSPTDDNNINPQAYGTGHFYSQSSYVSGSNKNISEDKLIRAVKAKIIENNTNGEIEDFIQALKLYFNASHIGIFEFYPLSMSLKLSGKNLEMSTSGVRETIKRMSPICVNLNNIYIDSQNYNIFTYNRNSSYGNTRYPMVIDDGIKKYQYISKSINLNSENKEYIKTNHTSFDNKLVSCIVGQFTDIKNNSTLLNCGDLSLQTITIEDGKTYICIKHNGYIYSTNIEVNKDIQYEIILHNDNNTIKLWVYEKINISGNLSKDTSYIYSVISNKNPTLEISDFIIIEETPIYMNCENINKEIMNYGDFNYHAILFGSKSESNVVLSEYYVTCYGEKHILFNCIENKNHLEIQTEDSLATDLTVKQNVFNYKNTHSGNTYCYFDGKSGVDYYLSYENTNCNINNIEISFDICCPVSINNGILLSNFVGNSTGNIDNSYISLHKNGSISIVMFVTMYNEEKEKYEENLYHFYSDEGIIKTGELSNIKIIINNEGVFIYKNDILQSDNKHIKQGFYYNMPNILKLCYATGHPSFKGIIKNLKFNIDGELGNNKHNLKLDADLKNTLADNYNIVEYINKGARFISVPQLISNTNNKDIYNNNIISVK